MKQSFIQLRRSKFCGKVNQTSQKHLRTCKSLLNVLRQGLTVFVTMLLAGQLNAQSGACSDGSYINYNSFVNFDMMSAGDLNITNSGTLTVSASGVYSNYGAITNAGTITVDNGGVLNIYGDMSNTGTITVNTGGRINFYGQVWVNNTGSAVTGSGDLWFTTSRPNIDASWITNAPCISTYSGGTFSQNLNGGGKNISIAPSLHINNASNVILTGTTSVAGPVVFEVDNGDVIMGNNDLILTSSATMSGYGPLRLVASSGTGHLIKKALPINSSFFFPVGRAEGDYTPATVTNNGTLADTFYVAVKNYSESASDEYDPTRGMDRTWNIYSDRGSAANFLLQHNSSTNNAGDYTTQGGDANAFVTQYLGQQWNPSDHRMQGTWQVGTGGLGSNAAGTVAGSSTHSRNYTATATSASADASFFSKSSNMLSPLPVELIDFTARQFNQNTAILTWKTSEEVNSQRFDVLRLSPNKEWQKIGSVAAQGHSLAVSEYSFVDMHPFTGINYYRLACVDIDEASKYSQIRSVEFEVNDKLQISIYPNPSGGVLNLSASEPIQEVVITDMVGKTIYTFNPDSGLSYLSLHLDQLQSGVYTVSVNGSNFRWVKD